MGPSTFVLFLKYFHSGKVNIKNPSPNLWYLCNFCLLLAFIVRGLYSGSSGKIGEYGLLLKYPLALGPD